MHGRGRSVLSRVVRVGALFKPLFKRLLVHSGKCPQKGKRDVIEPLCEPKLRTDTLGRDGESWGASPKLNGCPGVVFVFRPNAISAAFAFARRPNKRKF